MWSALRGIADIRHEQKEHADALTVLARALAIEEKAYGPQHPKLSPTLFRIGLAHREL